MSFEPIHSKMLECSKCSPIRTHAIVQGLFWRLNNGTRESTNYEWYNIRDLLVLLDRKNTQINTLKLTALNQARSLCHYATAIDGHKRLLIAIATSNFRRVNAIVAQGVRNNASVQTMISMIALSAQGLYQPKNYSEAEYELTYLLWKFGGPRVANLYAKACGGPHTTTVSRHRKVPPLLPSHSTPTIHEMTHNLDILYPVVDERAPSTGIRGYSISVDEIAVEKRLRWNPRNNMIVGVCREHSDECSLEFRTMAEANYLRDKLADGSIHLASEVRRWSSLRYPI